MSVSMREKERGGKSETVKHEKVNRNGELIVAPKSEDNVGKATRRDHLSVNLCKVKRAKNKAMIKSFTGSPGGKVVCRILFLMPCHCVFYCFWKCLWMTHLVIFRATLEHLKQQE